MSRWHDATCIDVWHLTLAVKLISSCHTTSVTSFTRNPLWSFTSSFKKIIHKSIRLVSIPGARWCWVHQPEFIMGCRKTVFVQWEKSSMFKKKTCKFYWVFCWCSAPKGLLACSCIPSANLRLGSSRHDYVSILQVELVLGPLAQPPRISAKLSNLSHPLGPRCLAPMQ